MKCFCAVLLVIFAGQVVAQTSSTSLTPIAAPAATPATQNISVGSAQESRPMKYLAEHLQVRYFSEFLGPNVVKWDDNQVDVDTKGNYAKSSEPIGMFHQFSFRWKIASETRIFAEPRFTTHFGDRNEISAGDDQHAFRMEDFRAGVMSKYWVDGSGRWSTTVRAGARLPTSQASRDAQIVAQPEMLHITSFQANSRFNVSLWNQIRYYAYESSVDEERWRLYTGPSVTYAFNDSYELFVMYESELQHRAPAGKRDYFHARDILQDVYAGVNININPSLTVYPFIRTAQLRKFNDETMQIGAWVMGAVF